MEIFCTGGVLIIMVPLGERCCLQALLVDLAGIWLVIVHCQKLDDRPTIFCDILIKLNCDI